MHGETRGQRLLQLVGLVGVKDGQGVEVLGAPDFELDDILGALDFDALGILAPGGEQEVLDLADLLRHGGRRSVRPRRGRVSPDSSSNKLRSSEKDLGFGALSA